MEVMMALSTVQKKALEMMKNICRFVDDPEEILERAVDLIHSTSEVYDWVGIYILERDGQTLRLFRYYHGRPTPHERIPISSGICGAAVRENQALIVPDVNADPRYLACSLETRSEIVVPVRYRGEVIGEIDIDSDTLDAFDERDREFLEKMARMISPSVQQYRFKKTFG